MTEIRIDNDRRFISNLSISIRRELDDPISGRLMREYGAVFVAGGGVRAPDRIVFRNEDEVEQFQLSVEIESLQFDNITIELQSAAADKLSQAAEKVRSLGLSLSPRGRDSGRRSYAQTVELWNSRVEPALSHWVGERCLDAHRANRIRDLSPFEQVTEIFALEDEGMFFAKDLSKSIIYSVAPPGTSQHLSMIAFDVREFDDPAVRQILADHFWYQTVVSDLPHFTYLGAPAAELVSVGLKRLVNQGRTFYVPDI